MFIVIFFPKKTIKNAENLGVNFWKDAQKKFSGQKKYIEQDWESINVTIKVTGISNVAAV